MRVISFILIASVIASVLAAHQTVADTKSRKRDLADVAASLSEEDLKILNQLLADLLNLCSPQFPQVIPFPSKIFKLI